nr:terminase family protein [Cyanobium sp. PCC 7001]
MPGGRYSGKSLLAAILVLRAMDSHGPAFRGVIARESLKGGEKLLALVHGLLRWYSKGKAKFQKVERRWTLPNGATLTFEQLGDSRSQDKLQGGDYSFLLVDDCGLVDQKLVRRVTTNLRTTAPGVHPQLVVTLNPGDRYSAAWAPLVRVRVRGDLTPVTSPDWSGQRWIIAHSSIFDNTSLTRDQREAYIRLLKADAYGRPHLEAQQIEGSWDASGGGLFSGIDLAPARLPDPTPGGSGAHLWNGQLPRPLPGAEVFLAMDWGGTVPTWCGLFWLVPQTLVIDGVRIAPDSLVLLDEVHTAMTLPSGELDPERSTGLATTREVAVMVGAMVRRWGVLMALIPLRNRVLDAAAFAQTGSSQGSIGEELGRAGLVMTPSPKGDRVSGFNLIAERFHRCNSGAPGLYAATGCRYYWTSLLAVSPHPTRQGDCTGPDHALDATAYLCRALAGGVGMTSGPRWR